MNQRTQGAAPLPTHLQVFSQTWPLLYSSVPSQQSEAEVRAKIREGKGLLPLAPASFPGSPEYPHLPHTPSLTRLEGMYKGLYPVLVQWKLPLGQAAVPAEKESLLNVFQARHVSSIHRKHQKNRWKLAVVVNVCNPSSWEIKSSISSSRTFSASQSVEASLGYIRVSAKQNKPRTKGRNYLRRPATESSLLELLLRPFKKVWQPTPNSSFAFTSP